MRGGLKVPGWYLARYNSPATLLVPNCNGSAVPLGSISDVERRGHIAWATIWPPHSNTQAIVQQIKKTNTYPKSGMTQEGLW